MDEIPFLFEDESVVELKDIDATFYGGFSIPGNIGVVKGHRREKMGYPQVYIEWDKNHWAYNGLNDGWTFESHFNLVKEPAVADKEEIAAIVEAVMAKMKNEGINEASFVSDEPPYETRVIEAVEGIENSEAVIIMSLHKTSGGFIPKIDMESKNMMAEEILNLQMANLVSVCYQNVVSKLVEQESVS